MTKKIIAVIWSEACGLSSAKCCLDEDLESVCFERTDDIGGLCRYQESPEEGRVSIYKLVIINTSKEMMCFSDYSIPDHHLNFMHNSQVIKYFRMYTKDFNLLKYIQFKLDEPHCQFLVPPPAPPGSPHSPQPPLTLHCNITESYPSSSPIWFVDSDDPTLTSILERLEDTKNNNSLPQQLKWLICELCRLYNLPKHLDVEMLDQPLPTGQNGITEEVTSED
ncbi:Ubiquitin-conjugating enzyme E2 Q2 [Sciurus carolinensis]|uniref:Flavin-containing monooxygenase n=1 Tax=Sciurus carolinensis TaxID=30640 RepID=A0AA41MLR6_SCICA|nr:Ubiquitin-conjugating enzyme E2 Q2 [Sciurus carolinensis]